MSDEAVSMTNIDPAETLGALVNAHPALARMFERHGFDYCCGGGQSLADACAARGVDPAALAAEIADVVDARGASDWPTMDAAALVDHIENSHHRYLGDELPRLSALMAKIVTVHGERLPELHDIASCYEAIRLDLEPHLLKEERILFPMIRELAAASETVPGFHCGTLQNPISVMTRDHDHVGALFARLRELTNGYDVPADSCASYQACFVGLAQLESDTHLHIHKENNLLFPLVVHMEQSRRPR